MSMPAKQKVVSVVIVGVAVAFQWFFMFTKHDPSLRPVIPFDDDPYDALGSFTSIVDILLCLLLLWRAFRPYAGRAPLPGQIQYLRRTHAAVPLLILVTLAADAIAMVRHPRMWIGADSQNKLLALFAGMMVVSGGTLWLVRSTAPEIAVARRRNAKISSWVVASISLLILAFYPEHLIQRLSTHLVTVLIGDLLLFAPVSVLLRSLLPDPETSEEGHAPTRLGSVLVWTGGVLAALLIGIWLFLAEMTEGGGPMPPLRLRLLVASVYIGLTVGGMLVAVAFLRRPLGLGQSKIAPSNR